MLSPLVQSCSAGRPSGIFRHGSRNCPSVICPCISFARSTAWRGIYKMSWPHTGYIQVVFGPASHLGIRYHMRSRCLKSWNDIFNHAPRELPFKQADGRQFWQSREAAANWSWPAPVSGLTARLKKSRMPSGMPGGFILVGPSGCCGGCSPSGRVFWEESTLPPTSTGSCAKNFEGRTQTKTPAFLR